jgi:hypothetical protein
MESACNIFRTGGRGILPGNKACDGKRLENGRHYSGKAIFKSPVKTINNEWPIDNVHEALSIAAIGRPLSLAVNQHGKTSR